MPIDVQMPDGTIIQGVPDNITQEELMSRYQAFLNQPPEVGAGEAFERSFGQQFMENVSALPSLAATAGIRFATGQPLFGEGHPGAPELGDRIIPTPSGAEITSAVRASQQGLIGILRGEKFDFERRRGEDLARSAEAELQRPNVSTAGRVSADITTVLAGRGPRARAGGRLRASSPATAILPKLEPGVKAFAEDLAKAAVERHLPRGIGRALDVGLDAALLEALEGGDAANAALVGAGLQAGGSMTIALTKPIFSTKTGLLASVGVTALAFGLLDNLIPGDDSPLEQIESATEKALAVIALGALARAGGLARLNPQGTIGKNLPAIADAIPSLPRTAILSMVKDLRDPAVAEVGQQFAAAPESFGDNLDVLQQAAMNGTFGDTVRRLGLVPPSLDGQNAQ